MSSDTARRPDAPVPAAPASGTAPAPDRLGAEVRESAVLLVMSMLVTVGLASGVQALIALLS